MSKGAKTSFPGQHPDEKVELVFHQHPIVMRRHLIFGMLIILGGVLPLLWFPQAYDLGVKIAWGGLGVVVCYWTYIWVSWYYSVYIVTNQRLIDVRQKGFFNRRVAEYSLDKVQNVSYHIKGLQAVVFKFGDITAQTYVGDLVMEYIYKPVQIHSRIIDVMRAAGHSTPPGI